MYDRTLSDMAIQKKSTLHLVLYVRSGIQIFVKTLTVEKITTTDLSIETLPMCVRLLIKMLRGYIENCASDCRRGQQFYKFHEKNCRRAKNGVKKCRIHQNPTNMVLETSRCHQIMSDTPLKSHEEATCSNNIHICDVF